MDPLDKYPGHPLGYPNKDGKPDSVAEGFLVLIILGLAIVGLIHSQEILVWVKKIVSSIPPFVAAGAVLVIGIVMFVVRQLYGVAYGAAEIAFAVVSAWVTAAGAQNFASIPVMISLLGSAYLVVRGCDNIEKTLRRREEKEKERIEKTSHPAASASAAGS